MLLEQHVLLVRLQLAKAVRHEVAQVIRNGVARIRAQLRDQLGPLQVAPGARIDVVLEPGKPDVLVPRQVVAENTPSSVVQLATKRPAVRVLEFERLEAGVAKPEVGVVKGLSLEVSHKQAAAKVDIHAVSLLSSIEYIL